MYMALTEDYHVTMNVFGDAIKADDWLGLGIGTVSQADCRLRHSAAAAASEICDWSNRHRRSPLKSGLVILAATDMGKLKCRLAPEIGVTCGAHLSIEGSERERFVNDLHPSFL